MKLAIFTLYSCSDDKEMYKKPWCKSKFVVLLIKPIAFSWRSCYLHCCMVLRSLLLDQRAVVAYTWERGFDSLADNKLQQSKLTGLLAGIRACIRSLKIDLTFVFQHQKCYQYFRETGPWSYHINHATKSIWLTSGVLVVTIKSEGGLLGSKWRNIFRETHYINFQDPKHNWTPKVSRSSHF